MLRSQAHGVVRKYVMSRPLLGRSYYHTAAYWVDGLLVDSGCAYTARELLTALGDLPVAQVANTHCHEDHIGGNTLLQLKRGARIVAHPLALPVLANPRLQHLQLYRRLFWGRPGPSQAEAVGEWVATEHHRFRVLPTPGHSPDHIALYEPERGWLFAGDAYIGGQDKSARPEYDVYAIIASLKRMLALDLTVLFPGSGTVRNDPLAAIQAKVDYLEGLGAEVRRLHGQGLSVPEIERRLLGRPQYIVWLTGGHFTGANLVRAYLRNQ